MYSRDSVPAYDENEVSEPAQELIDAFTEIGSPPHELEIKVEAMCVLMRDLSLDNGMGKNAPLVIRAIHRHFVEVEHLKTGKRHLITRITFKFKPRYCNYFVHRYQFPVRLAYALTFNTCQG